MGEVGVALHAYLHKDHTCHKYNDSAILIMDGELFCAKHHKAIWKHG